MIPLELWDLCVGDRILWDSMREPNFAAVLLEALHRLQAGEASTRSDGPVPKEAREFDAVFICGGNALGEDLRRLAAGACWPIIFSDEGSFIGERGGFHLLATHQRNGLVADLGQTQLKVSAGGRRWTFPRDFSRLPMRDDLADPQAPAHRSELRSFLGEGLRCAARESPTPIEALILALPARLDDRGVPEGSSYVGMKGDQDLVTDALKIARLTDLPVWVLNDAELAAVSARLHPALSPNQRTLVLTLGFGLGAALLTPCP